MRTVFQAAATYKALLASAFVAIAGLVMLLVAARWGILVERPFVQAVVRDVGSLLFASLSVAIVWELTVKRDFLREIFEVSKLSTEIQQSGLSGISFRFYKIDWESLFRTAKEFDVFIAYGGSWRGTTETFLREFARRSGTKARVVLPDPTNKALMAELARRFSKTEQDMASTVESAVRDFREMLGGGKCDVSLVVTDRTPTYGYYRFDRTLVVSLYTHRRGRTNVPAFTMDASGTLPEFFLTDFDDLFSSGKVPCECAPSAGQGGAI